MVSYNTQMKDKTSQLILDQKLTHQSGRIEELKVWKVTVSNKYPDGIRYRLVLVDPKTKDILVLFDNHYPKGHHVHLGKIERDYEFKGVRKLLEDFKRNVDRLNQKESK